MDSSLNGVDCIVVHQLNKLRRESQRRRTCIEGVFAKLLRKLHEVTLHELDLILQVSSLGIPASAADLEVVIIQGNDISVREARNLSGGAANTTANVENTHPGTKGHLRGEIVLVASKGRSECLALVEAREVERLGPSVFVKLGGTVVVAWTGK
jgi:hypothetical protein